MAKWHAVAKGYRVVGCTILGGWSVLSPVEGILTILQRGNVTGTNKFGLLLALIDLAPQIDPETRDLEFTDLALKLLEIHWDHVREYAGNGSPLRQVSSGNKANSQVIVQVQRLRALSDGTDLSFEMARKVLPAAEWNISINRVARDTARNPVAKLQTIRGTDEAPFLFNPANAGSSLVLFDGVRESLTTFGPLLRALIEARFVEQVMRMNSPIFEQVSLHEFLFSDSRHMPSAGFREKLRDIQDGRCFYTGSKLGYKQVGKGDQLDHVLPWSRVRLSTAENFVLASSTANNAKRAMLLSEGFLRRWLDHLALHQAELEAAAQEHLWVSDRARTLRVAESLYLLTPTGAVLWQPAFKAPLDESSRAQCVDAIRGYV